MKTLKLEYEKRVFYLLSPSTVCALVNRTFKERKYIFPH